jgi:hypothetical protein
MRTFTCCSTFLYGADGQPSGRQYRNGGQASWQVFEMASKWVGRQAGWRLDRMAGVGMVGRPAGRSLGWPAGGQATGEQEEHLA